jgi:AraC family transcriptional regulator
MAVKGDTEMEYRIEEKPEIRIVGVPKRLEFDMEKNFVTVPVFWEKVKKSKFFPQIRDLMNQSPAGILGITRYQNRTEVEHYIAVASDKPAPDGTVEYVIPAATWVIFECTGKFPEAIQELYRRFYTEWLPFSGYQYAETHDIEVYPVSEREAQKAEIWFAVYQ